MLSVCEQCGGEFPPRTNKRFCSETCRVKARDARRGPSVVNRKPNTSCVVCGTAFYARPSERAKGFGRCCSTLCHSRFVVRHPEYIPHRKGRAGKRPDLNDQFFRSTWEANWARYLNTQVDQGAITAWEFESRSFEFPDAPHTYLPDFLVKLPDGSEVYQELKGYLDERGVSKLRQMRIHFPDVALQYVGKLAYLTTAASVANTIPYWEF